MNTVTRTLLRAAGAALTVAVLGAQAHAAGYGQGVADRPATEKSAKEKQRDLERKQRLEETDRNYNTTIKSQPNSKEKFDPWKGSR